MTTRRIALFWIAALALIVWSYGIAKWAPASAPAVGASLAVDDALPVPGMKSTDGQLAFWRERIEQAPHDFISLTYLGQAFLRKARETGDVADYERAESALRKAVDLDPDYEFALAYLAAARFAKHDFQGGLNLATRVYTFDPQALQALATIGDAHLELGNYDEAEAAYQQLVDRAPSAPALQPTCSAGLAPRSPGPGASTHAAGGRRCRERRGLARERRLVPMLARRAGVRHRSTTAGGLALHCRAPAVPRLLPGTRRPWPYSRG